MDQNTTIVLIVLIIAIILHILMHIVMATIGMVKTIRRINIKMMNRP